VRGLTLANTHTQNLSLCLSLSLSLSLSHTHTHTHSRSFRLERTAEILASLHGTIVLREPPTSAAAATTNSSFSSHCNTLATAPFSSPLPHTVAKRDSEGTSKPAVHSRAPKPALKCGKGKQGSSSTTTLSFAAVVNQTCASSASSNAAGDTGCGAKKERDTPTNLASTVMTPTNAEPTAVYLKASPVRVIERSEWGGVGLGEKKGLCVCWFEVLDESGDM
jgi:hypothetical protein